MARWRGGFSGPCRSPGRWPPCGPGTRGRVTVRQGGTVRTLWWSDGHIRAVTAESDHQWLGTWLLTKGLVRGPELARALKTRADGERLGAALVRTGELNPLRLQVELEELSLALAARIVVAEGSFEAELGATLPAGTEMVNRSVRAFCAAGVRRVPDAAVLERILGEGASGRRRRPRWPQTPGSNSAPSSGSCSLA